MPLSADTITEKVLKEYRSFVVTDHIHIDLNHKPDVMWCIDVIENTLRLIELNMCDTRRINSVHTYLNILNILRLEVDRS